MNRGLWTALILVVGLPVGERGRAQNAGVLGEKIGRPESVTGIWETQDGPEDVVGVSMEIDTRGEPGQDLRAPQEVEALAKTVYMRRRGVPEPVWMGGSYRPSDVSHGEHALTWKIPTDVPGELGLDSRPGPQGWAGWIERGGKRKAVLLRRMSVSEAQSDIVGTWRSSTREDCLHVALGVDGALTAWIDMLVDMQRIRWAPWLKPAEMMERYGAPLKVEQVGPGVFVFETTTGMGMPGRILVRETAGGKRLLGERNGPGTEWTRVKGESCRGG